MTTLQPASRRLIASGLVAATLTTGAFASAAIAPMASAATADKTQLLSQFEDWWVPGKYDAATDATKKATAFTGNVTEQGAPILAHSDEIVQGINHAGASSADQQARALGDVPMDWVVTLHDGLGPVLGKYLQEGVADKKLPLTTAAMTGADSSTGTAKVDFNFPRPFMQTEDSDYGDRSRNGLNELKTLKPQLDITRVADQTVDGTTQSAQYNDFVGLGTKGAGNLNQAFPSGHTTFACAKSVTLAELLPELGPEIITRGSEAGNNRIVLGVNYPLDVMGGRIAGHVNVATQLSNSTYAEGTIAPAREELVSYLTQRCQADNHGQTLNECIANTGKYSNSFTDPVSTVPVTDRASALKVYRERMSYNFNNVTPVGDVARVPDSAPALLATTFPKLTNEQRRVVLAKTEIQSGGPLDLTSEGWERINLPAAMSSKVTVSLNGEVLKVEPGQDAPSVVTASAETPAQGGSSLSSNGGIFGLIALIGGAAVAAFVAALNSGILPPQITALLPH